MEASQTRREFSNLGIERKASNYGVVLLLIVVTFAFTSAMPSEPWARTVSLILQALVLISALAQSHVGLRLMRIAVGLALLAVAVAVVLLFLGQNDGSTFDLRTTGAALIITALLVSVVPVAIGKGVIDSLRRNDRVTTQAVVGSVCIFLIFGILFSTVYNAIGAIEDANFFASGDGNPQTYIYFSYVTLTTLGYGDFVPATPVGRTFAILEALLGQVYLVTIVALLIGNVARNAVREPRSGSRSE